MRSDTYQLFSAMAIAFTVCLVFYIITNPCHTCQTTDLKMEFDFNCADVQKIEESGKFVAQNLCENPQKIIIRYKQDNGNILKEETDCLVEGGSQLLKYFDSQSIHTISYERCFPICQNCD